MPALRESEPRILLDLETNSFLEKPNLESITATRKKSGRLIAGTSAYTSSDFFKSSTKLKPKAKCWNHYLSLEAKSRQASCLKSAAKHLKNPSLISLGGGFPVAENFPFEEISIKVPKPPCFTEKETRETGVTLRAGKYDTVEEKSEYDLSIALNYGLGTGSAQLIRFITEHTEVVSNPPYADWSCALTVGSTSALDHVFRMFCERGDYILSEEYTFASAVETAIPLGVKFLGVPIDDEGLIPDALDEMLCSWDQKLRGARRPFLLYTVPSGQNPTGATQGEARRRKLYSVCQKHDLYIIEDEPYYFLQMQPYTGCDTAPLPPPTSNTEFLKSLVPTFVSMDTDGRVLRMDSFSKVIAPGMRTGWITASEQIVERFIRTNEVSVQNPSGLSQIVLFKLLDEHWGHDGYLKWLINLRIEYSRRRDVILRACERYLPKGVVTWNPPMAGMFLWLKINWHSHPAASIKSIIEIEEEIFLKAINHGVLVSRGSWFVADRTNAMPTEMFFRTTYAAATSEKMEEAIEKFGSAIRDSFNLASS
ncbi:Aromatic amino acid aminotransferase [Podosphaera aphanis]|nr:Aromatic amino acid aminotransferase [Podosphaera aphanis]